MVSMLAIKLKGSLETSSAHSGGASAALSRLLEALRDEDIGTTEYLSDGIRYVRAYPLLFRTRNQLAAFNRGEIRFRDSDGTTVADYSFEYEYSRLLLLPIVLLVALIGLPEHSNHVFAIGGAAAVVVVIGVTIIFYQVRLWLKSILQSSAHK